MISNKVNYPWADSFNLQSNSSPKNATRDCLCLALPQDGMEEVIFMDELGRQTKLTLKPLRLSSFIKPGHLGLAAGGHSVLNSCIVPAPWGSFPWTPMRPCCRKQHHEDFTA